MTHVYLTFRAKGRGQHPLSGRKGSFSYADYEENYQALKPIALKKEDCGTWAPAARGEAVPKKGISHSEGLLKFIDTQGITWHSFYRTIGGHHACLETFTRALGLRPFPLNL